MDCSLMRLWECDQNGVLRGHVLRELNPGHFEQPLGGDDCVGLCVLIADKHDPRDSGLNDQFRAVIAGKEDTEHRAAVA